MAASYCSSSVTFSFYPGPKNKPSASPFPAHTKSFLRPGDDCSVFRLRSAPAPPPFVHRLRAVSLTSPPPPPPAKVREPLKIMISGAPASGKGTQCELIREKYDLVHIAAGDLLRAEIAAGTENGKRAKEFMEIGQLVPDEIAVMMVKDRLMEPDSMEKGWLLDGYPRSLSQATALRGFGFHPDIFILLEVPEEVLVERVVGRRLDPVTGKIYHLQYSPPETEEIAARLTHRFDDTVEKVKLRLQTHNQNVESVLSLFEDRMIKVDGSLSKEAVFEQIDSALSKLVEQRAEMMGSAIA